MATMLRGARRRRDDRLLEKGPLTSDAPDALVGGDRELAQDPLRPAVRASSTTSFRTCSSTARSSSSSSCRRSATGPGRRLGVEGQLPVPRDECRSETLSVWGRGDAKRELPDYGLVDLELGIPTTARRSRRPARRSSHCPTMTGRPCPIRSFLPQRPRLSNGHGAEIMSDLPKSVHINEEGPREGFQIEKGPIPTARKIELIDALSETGLKQIQVCSFVPAEERARHGRCRRGGAGLHAAPGRALYRRCGSTTRGWSARWRPASSTSRARSSLTRVARRS